MPTQGMPNGTLPSTKTSAAKVGQRRHLKVATHRAKAFGQGIGGWAVQGVRVGAVKEASAMEEDLTVRRR